MLTELFTGKTDQLPNWRDDPTYQETKAAEDAALTKAAQLDSEYVRLSRELNAGSEIIRTAPPGHPINQVQYQSVQADRDATRATRAREQAEAMAKAAVQRAGEDAGLAKWAEAEANIFPKLIDWCREYADLRVQVQERTSVQLPEIACSVCMTPGDLRTFIENVRRSFRA